MGLIANMHLQVWGYLKEKVKSQHEGNVEMFLPWEL